MTAIARSVLRFTREAFENFGEHRLLPSAAALAFYSSLSFAPLIVLLLWALTTLSPGWESALVRTVANLFGQPGVTAVHLLIDSARSRPAFGHVAGLIGLGVTVFSASAVFAQLQASLNDIWGLQARPDKAVSAWLRARARAAGLAVGFTFLMIVSFAVSAAIRWLADGDAAVWTIGEYVLSLVVFVFAFGAIYRVLPDAEIAWSDACLGALVTTVLFLIGKALIGFYLTNAHIGGAYGPAGTVVVLLTWLYYAAVVVLLGAELTHAIARLRGHPLRPAPQAEAIAKNQA